MTTISKTFNPKDLPAWAQADKAIVWYCERSYSYRCSVCSATSADMKKMLKRLAKSHMETKP